MLSDIIGVPFALAKGLATTLKHFFMKPMTVQYPERPSIPTVWRGRHVLTRHRNGLEKCVGCSLCAAVCPSRAIYVEAGMNTDEHRVSPGERYASVYEINWIRCVWCGFCVEACPTEALMMTMDYELADYNRQDLVVRKEDLLEKEPESWKREGGLRSWTPKERLGIGR